VVSIEQLLRHHVNPQILKNGMPAFDILPNLFLTLRRQRGRGGGGKNVLSALQ